MKACKADEVREYFVNPKIRNKPLASHKFSQDPRSISCFITKNILSKVTSKYHLSILTCLSRVSQNPFQNNKSCESSITTIYQSEISKICIRQYLPLSQSVFYEISLHCIFRTMSHFVALRAYFSFLRVCRLFLFLSFFLFLLWSLLLAEVLRKVLSILMIKQYSCS